jgi:hypothetical protein
VIFLLLRGSRLVRSDLWDLGCVTAYTLKLPWLPTYVHTSDGLEQVVSSREPLYPSGTKTAAWSIRIEFREQGYSVIMEQAGPVRKSSPSPYHKKEMTLFWLS